MSGAVAIGVLVTAGLYLILQRGIVRMVIGFTLISHGINLLLVRSGGPARGIPIAPYRGMPADPTVQAFALTAIVVGLGTSVFLLAVALARARTHREDDVEGDE